jgi:hypothetical protein
MFCEAAYPVPVNVMSIVKSLMPVVLDATVNVRRHGCMYPAGTFNVSADVRFHVNVRYEGQVVGVQFPVVRVRLIGEFPVFIKYT